MTTTSAVLALLPRHHRRVAQIPAAIRNDFADPLASRRRVHKVARETVALDLLSSGRLIFAADLDSTPE